MGNEIAAVKNIHLPSSLVLSNKVNSILSNAEKKSNARYPIVPKKGTKKGELNNIIVC